MPQLFLDHGAYGESNRLGIDAPAWGIPQEGDGSALTPAAASSVGEIQIKGIPADGKVIIIAGATITAKTTVAAKNQFLIGASAAATATNIVNLINTYGTGNNQCDVAVGTGVARSLGNLAERLPNMVYARIKPATTDVVQLMFRIGSAQLNKANNGNVAITQSTNWNGTDTSADSNVGNGGIIEFDGGSGGCFGWFSAVNSIGVSSSIALATYGVFSYPPHVCANGSGVSNYALTINDRVWCRNNGKTISKSITSSQSYGRSHASPLWMTVDSNTIWTGDTPSAQMTFRLTADANSITSNLSLYSTNNQLVFEAVERFGFRFSVGGANTSGVSTSIIWGAQTSNNLFRGIEFYEDHTSSTGIWNVFGTLVSCSTSGSGRLSNHLENCRFKFATARTTINSNMSLAIGNGAFGDYASLIFDNVVVDYNYTGAGDPTVGLISGANTNGSVDIRINGGEIVSSVTGGFPLLTGTGWAGEVHIAVHGIKGAKITSAIAGFQVAAGLRTWVNSRHSEISLPDSTRTMRYECATGVADWLPSQGYPHLNAVLPDGTGWSMRALWVSTVDVVKFGRPFTMPRIVKQYREADAGKIITLKFWCKDSLSFDDRNFRVTWLYVDSTGAMRSAITGGSAVVNASDTWSNTGSYAGPTYADKSISLDTDTVSIKQNTEIVAIVSFMGAPSSGTNENLFFDPELTLAAT